MKSARTRQPRRSEPDVGPPVAESTAAPGNKEETELSTDPGVTANDASAEIDEPESAPEAALETLDSISPIDDPQGKPSTSEP